jgi:glucose-1-phosphate cytidylyltransferase
MAFADLSDDADLAEEFGFHLAHGKVGTVLGIKPPSRFGQFRMDGDIARQFEEKPDVRGSWVNGGYFFFHRRFLKHLSLDEDCVLERKPLMGLAEDGELCVFRHEGFWACMDTQRDHDQLNRLWAEGKAPWRV